MTGFININKSVGVSSAKVVAAVKRLTGCPCGHMGTLDPLASGVLPVAIGNATRLFEYFLQKKKVYVATFRFGIETDTLDTEGEVIKSGGRIPSEEEILSVLPSLCGEILQTPPNYSAKNINGVKGYVLARRGVEFTIPPKKVCIDGIKLLGKVSDDGYSFEIACGAGTYIRAIARDMGKALSTCAVMSALKRTVSGVFRIEDSVKCEELTAENIYGHIIPTDEVLQLPSVYCSPSEDKKLFNGLSVRTEKADGTYKIYNSAGAFYGLAEVENSILKVRTKLC